jgi:hypothetical protein
MLDSLAQFASKVGLCINTDKTEVLTVPDTIDAAITCGRDELGQPLLLKKCRTFRYLGGVVPSVKEDFLRRRGLAWAAIYKLGTIWSSPTFPDILRSRLFSAIVETVFLYNAETWSLSPSLEQEIDAAHSALLRAAYNIHWPQRISNDQLYQRAHLWPPSITLKKRRLAMTGHLIRSEEYCPQPVHRLLLWQPTAPTRRGQGNRVTFFDRLASDSGAPATVPERIAQFVREQASRRCI